MTTCRSLFLLMALAPLVAYPTGAKAEFGSEPPPASDETLIYVMREGRFIGSGGRMWIAVNDQTVARVGNKDYAVIRAKAGRITLNMAVTGIAGPSIVLDDRPGQVVYIRFRPGDTEFTEVDEAEAAEFLRKEKQTDPIDELLPNNEEVAVLLNLSRLGFYLMRPATGAPEPDDAHATVTFFSRGDTRGLAFGIWSADGFVGTLAPHQSITMAVDAGEHYFLAGNIGKSLLKLEAEAGKRYFAWIDFGKMIGRVRLTPVGPDESDDLAEWLDESSPVEIDRALITSRILEREEIVTNYIETVIRQAAIGESDYHLLGAEHAF